MILGDKSFFRISTILVIVFLFLSCSSNANKDGRDSDEGGYQIDISGLTMGTTYSVKLVADSEVEVDFKERLQVEIESLLINFNKVFSTYDPDSEISRLNESKEKEKGVSVSDSLRAGIARSIELSEFTRGKFDFTISPLVNLWGFGWVKEEQARKIPNDKKIKEVLELVNYNNVSIKGSKIFLKDNMELDLSAIAKGRGVDEIAKFLQAEGIENYLIEIGGEIRTLGLNKQNQPWKVAIASPDKNLASAAVFLNFSGQSIATSGDYQNYFLKNGEKYSHIIDPITGYPIEHNLASVSVISDNCEEADALATAILVMGEKEGIAFANSHNLAAYFIYYDEGEFAHYSTQGFEKFQTN